MDVERFVADGTTDAEVLDGNGEVWCVLQTIRRYATVLIRTWSEMGKWMETYLSSWSQSSVSSPNVV